MNLEHELRKTVASLIHSRLVNTPGFVARTSARGFLHLTRSTSRIGQSPLATVGAVSGGVRFSSGDRLVIIERSDAGYRAIVRTRVVGEVIVLYDELHSDLDTIGAALLDVLCVMRA